MFAQVSNASKYVLAVLCRSASVLRVCKVEWMGARGESGMPQLAAFFLAGRAECEMRTVRPHHCGGAAAPARRCVCTCAMLLSAAYRPTMLVGQRLVSSLVRCSGRWSGSAGVQQCTLPDAVDLPTRREPGPMLGVLHHQPCPGGKREHRVLSAICTC